MRSSIIALGTLIEWAEFSFYGYMAVTFSCLFFSPDNHYKMIWSFCIFSISYFIRPFASILWGFVGDHMGRKKVLFFSMMLMGIATCGIGFLPTYKQIGDLSTVFLILLRAIQGFGIASELVTAAIVLIESSHPKRKNFSVSWVNSSAAFGMALGALAAFIVALPTMPTWAWRIPFLLGSVSCFLGLYIRNTMQESNLFQKEAHISYKEYIHMIRLSLGSILEIFLIAAWAGSYIYICNIWWVSYVIEKHIASKNLAHMLATFSNFLVIILTPLFAILADRIGSYKQMIYGFICCILGIPLLFWFTNHHLLWMASTLYSLMDALLISSVFPYICELFPIKLRCTGVGISWNLGVLIFGGTGPALAQYLVFQYNTLHTLIYILMLTSSLPLIALIYSKHKKSIASKT